MIIGWDSWSLARVLTLFLGFGYFSFWIQIYLWHKRGKFHVWQMWIPVVALPIAGIVAILLAIFPVTWLIWLHSFISLLVIVTGSYGSLLHWKAISKRTGGIKKENLMSGPPITLPSIISSLGFIALLLVWF
ncbi:hypothetical protein [Sutcliffiella halmapala]|uniref:hypothetical protein n=1 Tax=Sutcliffiella halmapala TaxID=79882 RepID=UPI000995C5F0|nr:hypothetical protein [Sutcliffiella halmapala]